MSTVIFVLAFLLIALLAYMGRYSSRVVVEHTRVIAAPIRQVYAKVADFRHWSEWCPWLVPEDDVEVLLSDRTDAVASRCSWNSKRYGVGTLAHARLAPLQRIEQRLRCQLPFALRGKIVWKFTERDDQTEVSWRLQARVGFSLRFVAQTVKASLALDYRYAMDRLAALFEPLDAPRYSITHLGVHQSEASRYVYQSYEGSIQGLAAAGKKILTGLQQQLAQHDVLPAGAPLAVYVKTNTRLGTTHCYFGIPVATDHVGALPVRELPAQRVYKVRLQGRLSALDMAWYLAMQRLLAENIAPDQRRAPFEIYFVDADSAMENDRVTELHIPVL
jgi:ribosome-associated toxin RatA of RatAB toxin-antitoxin module